ncbi:MAG: nuclear transport factor 2 family protein [Acidobacteria bacterium]|nr:nuclear transport factor 2 family protein [Acidobacteriota bacterium]
MTPDELVRTFINHIEAKDLDAACALMSDDCEYDNVPMAKVFGIEAVKQILGPFTSGCSEINWVIVRQSATGDMTSGVVLNERIDRFKMGERWVELPLAGVFEIKSGKISLWRDYFDLATFQKAMAG